MLPGSLHTADKLIIHLPKRTVNIISGTQGYQQDCPICNNIVRHISYKNCLIYISPQHRPILEQQNMLIILQKHDTDLCSARGSSWQFWQALFDKINAAKLSWAITFCLTLLQKQIINRCCCNGK